MVTMSPGLTLASGDQGHRGDDEGGQHPGWVHAETCQGICCQAGAQILWTAGMAPSLCSGSGSDWH